LKKEKKKPAYAGFFVDGGRMASRRTVLQRNKPQAFQLGIALAGGGFLGAVYELGALAAIEEAIPGIDVLKAKSYVGVSAGAFVAAGLANGITPREMVRRFVDEGHDDGFDPAQMMRPALGEYAKRAAMTPGLAASALWNYATRPTSLMASFRRMGRALPAGFFDPSRAERYLERLLTSEGRTNDFKKLKSALRLVATNLNTGESVEFGMPGRDAVAISKAVLASAAFPGVFPPIEIDGQHYVDGALRKTLHASVALNDGVDLLICLNPIVPLDASKSKVKRPDLVETGLPGVLAQTMHSLIHSRMAVGMQRYAHAYPKSDIILFEPDHGDDELFFVNIFATAGRRRLCEHAYQSTRLQLLQRRHELGPQLARHGLQFDMTALTTPGHALFASAEAPPVRARARALAKAAGSLESTLDDLSAWMRAGRA
jgi:NTE family protein